MGSRARCMLTDTCTRSRNGATDDHTGSLVPTLLYHHIHQCSSWWCGCLLFVVKLDKAWHDDEADIQAAVTYHIHITS